MEKASEIFNTTTSEHTTGPFKFAVCMATYRRPNNKSPYYLQRSLSSVLNQTATNWHIFLVGDKYENQEEFDKAVSLVPSEKITAVNLPVAPERENITNPHERWKVAGANAFNHVHQLALNAGFDYILHLDDDDFFHTKKIQLLNYAVNLYPNSSFLFHYSDYIANLILPRFKRSDTIHPNNLIPQPEDCIHSSFCIHKSVLQNFSYSGWKPGCHQYLEGDKQFLNYLHTYLKDNPSSFSLFIPFNLCDHKIQREFV